MRFATGVFVHVPRLAFANALPLVLAIVVVAGCGSEGDRPDGKFEVVATTTQMADFVREVSGAGVRVEQILEPNADPHDYEPRPSDAIALGEAKLVFRSGGEPDEWLDDLIENAGGDARVVEALASVRTIGEGAEADPHWWQDPRNAARAVAAIRDALVEADPERRETYRRNAATYLNQLSRLDRAVAKCIDMIPREQRKLVTTHDALGYYADRYGLEVVGAVIPSLSTQAQPSSKDVERLVEQIREQEVKAIFPESSVNPKLEQAISREAGAQVGDALWADTLGPQGSSGATYVRSIQANTEAIVAGLTGGRERCRPGA